MEQIRIIILYFGGIFTFAFGLAWILPLAIAGQKEAKYRRANEIMSLLDLILILLGRIPIFWLFRSIPEIPSSYSAAKEIWKKEASIRTMFYLFSGSLIATIGSCSLPS